MCMVINPSFAIALDLRLILGTYQFLLVILDDLVDGYYIQAKNTFVGALLPANVKSMQAFLLLEPH